MAEQPQTAKPRRSDLLARILYALPAIAIAIFLIVQGGAIFALGLLVLAVVCLHELYSMFERFRPYAIAGFIAVALLLVAAEFGANYEVLAVAAAAVPLIFLVSLVSPSRQHPSIATAITLLGVVWIGLALAHAVLLRDLPHGGGIIVDVLVGTFLGDTGAYLGGRLFGRRKLAPSISPNKTVEGLIIGMVCAVGATWFAGLYQDWLPGTDALLLGLGIAVAAPLGDLFESLIKRDAGVKDSGRMFGPHGGALDRLDAVLFTAIAGYYIWNALL